MNNKRGLPVLTEEQEHGLQFFAAFKPPRKTVRPGQETIAMRLFSDSEQGFPGSEDERLLEVLSWIPVTSTILLPSRDNERIILLPAAFADHVGEVLIKAGFLVAAMTAIAANQIPSWEWVAQQVSTLLWEVAISDREGLILTLRDLADAYHLIPSQGY